jgi:hypothetical protein
VFRNRFLALLATLLIATGVGTQLPTTAEAGAASKTSPVTCGTLTSAPGNNHLLQLGGCNHPFLTGGSGNNDSNSLTWVIAWNTHKTLTIEFSLLNTASGCADGGQVGGLAYGGKVVATSGQYTHHFLGESAAFDLCLNLTDYVAVGLVPGTEFTIG